MSISESSRPTTIKNEEDILILNYLLSLYGTHKGIKNEMRGNITTWLMHYDVNIIEGKDSHAFTLMMNTSITKWNLAHLSPFLYICFCRVMNMDTKGNNKLPPKTKKEQIYDVIMDIIERFENIESLFACTLKEFIKLKLVASCSSNKELMDIIFSNIMNHTQDLLKYIKNVNNVKNINNYIICDAFMLKWGVVLIQNIMKIILRDLLTGLVK